MLAQAIFNSLVLGMTYVMMACGLSLILGVSLLINWPQGALYMAGAFVVYYVFTVLGINYFVALLASMVLIGGFGMLIEKGINYPLRDAGFLRIMGASLGAMIFIEGLALVVFGEEDKNVATVFPGKVSLIGATLPIDRMAVILLAGLIMLGLYYFLQRTKEGKAIRAVAQNKAFAAVQGISITKEDVG